jgi:hypothetical protein
MMNGAKPTKQSKTKKPFFPSMHEIIKALIQRSTVKNKQQVDFRAFQSG